MYLLFCASAWDNDSPREFDRLFNKVSVRWKVNKLFQLDLVVLEFRDSLFWYHGSWFQCLYRGVILCWSRTCNLWKFCINFGLISCCNKSFNISLKIAPVMVFLQLCRLRFQWCGRVFSGSSCCFLQEAPLTLSSSPWRWLQRVFILFSCQASLLQHTFFKIMKPLYIVLYIVHIVLCSMCNGPCSTLLPHKGVSSTVLWSFWISLIRIIV